MIENVLLYAPSIVLVDDGSTDGTNQILQELQKKNYDRIHLIVSPQNQGKGAALTKGIKYALAKIPFEILVTLDADGQHLPSEILHLIETIKKDSDLVIGCRQFDKMPLRSRLANTLISFLLHRIFPCAPQDNQSGFRAFTRKFASEIVEHVVGVRYEMEFLCILYALKNKRRIGSCPIRTIYFDGNKSSHFKVFKDSFQILKVFYNYLRKGGQ